MPRVTGSNDEGVKLREEKNYKDFYPSLNNDDLLPIISQKNDKQGLTIECPTDFELNSRAQFKQLIHNGNVTTEPLIIGGSIADFNRCEVNINDLDKPLDFSNRKKPGRKLGYRSKQDSGNPYDKFAYLSRFITTENRIGTSGVVASTESLLRQVIPNFSYLRSYYDMDEQDQLYLEYLKSKYPYLHLTNTEFEMLFSLLELEYTLLQSHIPTAPPPPAYIEQLCTICDAVETPTNTIVFCDNCNIAVHQDCYGIIFIPPGPWLCRACLQGNFESERPKCSVCPDRDGALKQTTIGSWTHVICAVWINELCFGNWHYLEPIEGIEKIPLSRWRLNCYICKKKYGACIQCSSKNCFTAYHVSCARRVGLTMTQLRTGSLADMAIGNDNILESFCDRHSMQTYQGTRINFGANISQLRENYNKIEAEDKINKSKNNIVIPNKFISMISKCLKALNPNTNANLVNATSLQFCKYWSLKREYNKGAPLLEITDDLINYPYNLLEEAEIEEKIKFIDILMQDVEKIGKLTDLVVDRNEQEIDLLETQRTIKNITSDPDTYVIKDKILNKLVKNDSFKVLTRNLRDDASLDILNRLKCFHFSDITTLKSQMQQLFERFRGMKEISRLIAFNIDKFTTLYNEIISSVDDINMDKLLKRDFFIDESNPLNIRARNWAGPVLMEEEELSDIEELNPAEKTEINDILSGKMYTSPDGKKKSGWPKGMKRKRKGKRWSRVKSNRIAGENLLLSDTKTSPLSKSHAESPVLHPVAKGENKGKSKTKVKEQLRYTNRTLRGSNNKKIKNSSISDTEGRNGPTSRKTTKLAKALPEKKPKKLETGKKRGPGRPPKASQPVQGNKQSSLKRK